MNKQINVGSLWTLLESILTFYRKVSNFLFHFDSRYLHILFYSYEKGEKVTEKILYLINSNLPILGVIAVYIYQLDCYSWWCDNTKAIPWCFSQQAIQLSFKKELFILADERKPPLLVIRWDPRSTSMKTCRKSVSGLKDDPASVAPLMLWGYCVGKTWPSAIMSQKTIQGVRPKMWRNLEITIFKLISPFLYMHKCSYNKPMSPSKKTISINVK